MAYIRIRSVGPESFPLNRPRRLTRDVVHHAVDALDLVDDAGRGFAQKLHVEGIEIRRHAVGRGDGTQPDDVVIGAAVTHDAHCLHRQQHGERLPDVVIEAGAADFLDIDFVGRHPFPGPGLAIRIPGEVTPQKVETLQKADAIFLDEIRKAGLYDAIWQAFAVLLPVKTVGVMGDARTYEDVLALRAVTSTDGMTADFYGFDMKFLGHVATRIINEVKGVNRVVYDVTSKPPGTIEWE